MTQVALKTDHPLFYRKEQGGKNPTKSSIPLCADFMTYYLHQSFAGPQPSATNLLSWNQSINYIELEALKSLQENAIK